MPDLGESSDLGVVLLTIFLLFAPFVGIQRAALRRRLKKLSNGAVVLASIGTLAAALLALAHLLTPLYAIGLVVANLAWLGFAVHTNRQVSRRRALAGPSR